jgi:hypothetical protein
MVIEEVLRTAVIVLLETRNESRTAAVSRGDCCAVTQRLETASWELSIVTVGTMRFLEMISKRTQS